MSIFWPPTETDKEISRRKVCLFSASSPNGVTMGSCLSCMGLTESGASSISPEELQKGGAYVKGDFSEEGFSDAEQADMEVPGPSVVVPWVLNEVVTSTDPVDYYKGEGQFELQAGRLLSCWTTYGDQFPSAFAAEVCLFMQKTEGGQLSETIRLVASFFLQMFTSTREALHIKNGSQELWASFLHCLSQRLQSACQASPVEAITMQERVKNLLEYMKSGVKENR